MFQLILDRIHRLVLRGMNYGMGRDWQNSGEIIALKKVKDLVNSEPSVLFDVGANQGDFSRLMMERWAECAYSLFVFEPSAKTFSSLKENVPESDNIHLHNLALGNNSGQTVLYTDREGSGLASVYQRDISHFNMTMSMQEMVPVTTLDSFCEKENISSIDFLKLDVEGHELAVLQGGKKMFKEGKVKIVQFEFGGCNIDSRTFFRDFYNFFKKDFNLFRILSHGLHRINAYAERLEIFQTSNYLAVRKELMAES